MKKFVPFFLLIVLSGCTLPSENRVRHSFLRAHPGYSVISVTKQEDIAHAQFHIKYMEPGDVLEHEDVWYYSHHPEAWKADEKDTVK